MGTFLFARLLLSISKIRRYRATVRLRPSEVSNEIKNHESCFYGEHGGQARLRDFAQNRSGNHLLDTERAAFLRARRSQTFWDPGSRAHLAETGIAPAVRAEVLSGYALFLLR